MKPKPTTVDQYIELAAPEAREKLEEMLACIRKAAQGATEGLKWGNIAFSYKRILVIVGAFKKHIGFYPTPSAMAHFKKELSKFESGRGSVQFPLDKPLPRALITKIVKMRVKESKEDDVKWIEK